MNDVGSINVVGKVQVVDALEQGYTMSINTSPLLTKFGFGYIALSGQQLKIVAKHVDFTANTIVDLVYEDPVRFAQTVMGMNADQEMDLSDAFMIVRNGSQHSQDPVAPCFE